LEYVSTTRERPRITRHRLLFGIPRPATHRGWLARHGGRGASEATAADGPVRAAPEIPFALTTDASVTEQVRARAASIVARASRFAPRPILYARMTVRTEQDPAVARPAVATAALDVSGRIVIAHAAADTPLDALDLLERRLRRNLDRLDARRRARRRKSAVAAGGLPGGGSASATML
jgi:ribosome-associated translation inhibitor RaiA